MVFNKLKKALSGNSSNTEDYLEIDLSSKKEDDSKVLVKLFVLKKYDDVTQILNILREGYTIGIIDIKTLRSKDPIELKRAVAKIKKTVDALEGNIAGFGENTLIVTPSFAKIQKEEIVRTEEVKKSKFDDL
ncbi:cell division protein SepF [Candidatus Woesearchaeota archaeon]|jgi:SepF-like predicted cell division protein (DUF552 family)|nr:cell division protein SepF [Candidatus Woesearchaeota archaeon]